MGVRVAAALAVAAIAIAFGTVLVSRSAGRTCPASLGKDWRCRTVTVPLDRSGRVHGSVRLAVVRWHRPGPARPAVMAFAGGPGGAAIPKAQKYRRILAPLLGDRDLVIFDQRGTGVSGP